MYFETSQKWEKKRKKEEKCRKRLTSEWREKWQTKLKRERETAMTWRKQRNRWLKNGTSNDRFPLYQSRRHDTQWIFSLVYFINYSCIYHPTCRWQSKHIIDRKKTHNKSTKKTNITIHQFAAFANWMEE